MRVPEQMVCVTNFSIAGLWLTGCCGCLWLVAFKEQFVGPFRVL